MRRMEDMRICRLLVPWYGSVAYRSSIGLRTRGYVVYWYCMDQLWRSVARPWYGQAPTHPNTAWTNGGEGTLRSAQGERSRGGRPGAPHIPPTTRDRSRGIGAETGNPRQATRDRSRGGLLCAPSHWKNHIYCPQPETGPTMLLLHGRTCLLPPSASGDADGSGGAEGSGGAFRVIDRLNTSTEGRGYGCEGCDAAAGEPPTRPV